MSTWVPNVKRTWLERIIIKILRCGVIPKHVAFIMDGNRRYAKKIHQETLAGHTRGFETFTEVLAGCRDLGITQVTIFSFSIENFKRSKEEVDYLMELFDVQARKVLSEMPKIESHEICIRFYGKIELLPKELQKTLAQIVLNTAKFNKFYLNICVAYTAREEITRTLQDLNECCLKNIIHSYDINHRLISNTMYSLGLNDPDILVRTSGEIRLSDFLIWQSSFSRIFFLNTLWPEFNLWNLFSVVLNYQYEYPALNELRQLYDERLFNEDKNYCEKIFTTIHSKTLNNDTIENLDEFIRQRELRIEQCFAYIKKKRLDEFSQILNNNLEMNHNHHNHHHRANSIKFILTDHCNNQLNICESSCISKSY